MAVGGLVIVVLVAYRTFRIVFTSEMKQLENLSVWKVAWEDHEISISENRMLKQILGLNWYKLTGRGKLDTGVR